MKFKLMTLLVCLPLLLCTGGCVRLVTGIGHAATGGAKATREKATKEKDSDATDPSANPSTASDEGEDEARHDPCSLVTKDEVEAVLGETVKDGVADGDDCNYDSLRPGQAGARISWLHGHAEAAIQGARAGIKMMNLGKPVEGLGDEAVFMAPGVLYVRKGDDLVTVSLVLAPDALDKTKTLAGKALSRL